VLARLLTAATLARTAEAGAAVVLLLASLREYGEPATGALILSALLVPHVLAGPFVGLVTDRARRPRLVHAGFAALFGVALGGVLLLIGRVPVPVVLLLAVVAGGCGPMIFGGLSSRLDDVVPAPRRPRARGLDAATYNVAEIAGPAAGALLVAASSVPVAAVVLAAACLLAAATLLTVTGGATDGVAVHGAADSGAVDGAAVDGGGAGRRVTVAATSGAADGGTAAAVDRPGPTAGPAQLPKQIAALVPERDAVRPGVRDGLAAIVGSRPLLAVTAATAVAAYVRGMITPVAVVLGVAAGRAAGGGLLVTALGVGALCGSLLVARFPARFAAGFAAGFAARFPAHLVVMGCTLGVGLAFAGVAAGVLAGVPWPLLVVLFAVAGVLDGPLLSSVLQVRSVEAPPGTRTQVFTLGAGIKLTAAAVGAATFTVLAAAPPAVLVAVLAAGHLAAAAVGALLLRRR
jgi:MFS family permease